MNVLAICILVICGILTCWRGLEPKTSSALALFAPARRVIQSPSAVVSPTVSLVLNQNAGNVKDGASLRIRVTITNNGTTPLPYQPGYGALRITMKSDEEELERTPFHHELRGDPHIETGGRTLSGSQVTVFIDPGKSVEEVLDLRKLYQIKTFGKFSVSAELYDERTGTYIRSDVLWIEAGPARV